MVTGRFEKLSLDADDHDDTIPSHGIRRRKSLEIFLEDLFSKRVPKREEALSKLVKAFTRNVELDFAEKNFVTLQHRCENSIKRGSAKEICLASQNIALLALTIGYGDNANEVYRESLPTLCGALKSRLESIRLLECLAIITLVGAKDFEDTQSSMKKIWEFIHLESSSSVVARKHPAPVLAAAISAWSLLLTTMDSWKIDSKYWKEVIPYFVNLLEEYSNKSVRRVCVEALGLICEKGCLDKFTNRYSSIQELKDDLVKQFDSVCDPELGFSKFFEVPSGHLHIGGQNLTYSTWSELKKVEYMKCFLGEGFVKHLLENELLHSIFSFKSKSNRPLGPELYVSETEEVTKKFFLPGRGKDTLKILLTSSKSPLRKAKTQQLNKQRMRAHGEKIGDFMRDDEMLPAQC